jgi:hypothetical protein
VLGGYQELKENHLDFQERPILTINLVDYQFFLEARWFRAARVLV